MKKITYAETEDAELTADEMLRKLIALPQTWIVVLCLMVGAGFIGWWAALTMMR